MTTAKEEQFAFAAALGAELSDYGPHLVGCLAAKLIRWATQYQALNVRECNEGETSESDAAGQRIVKKVRAALAPYGITATFQGDPRGPAVKLKLPRTKRANDFGGEGFYCVPQPLCTI